ncbi:MAG: protein kinase domain-containing protein, partial [Hydrogenophaga sp.]
LNRRPDGSSEGACSLVYRIQHLVLGRRLVLKVMLASGEDGSTAGKANVATLLASVMARRHAREVVLPQLAPHLHIVPVLHHFVGDMAPFAAHVHELMRPALTRQTLCVVMPEFPSSLQRLLRRVALRGVGWLGEAKAAKLMMQLLLAVRHMGQQGLAHCDIKPDNVLVDPGTWHVVVSDFGEAQWLLRTDGSPRPLSL